ncbi:MAG: histidine--tRNA ligase, partial [bacterium]|nr:histidine--tRNA ligase [bacterium]
MSNQIIQPRTLKGFRDFLPDDMRIREKVINTFKQEFEKYGYEPLETPVLEYADILMGKYGEEAEQLMYTFEDRGGRKVAMKYDVTVPAARVLAQYQNQLTLPFKRYQIQPVWRAENTQKGRLREFYQCDADTFGTDSIIAEAEFIQMGIEILKKLGFENFFAKINNRKIIDGITQYAGISKDQFASVCTTIDKLEKIGEDGVKKELEERKISNESITKIFEVISQKAESSLELLDKVSSILATIPEAQKGVEELRKILNLLKAGGIKETFYKVDLSIIRGLAYYTGPIWEFEVTGGNVGSVGSGGRYDKLVGLYVGKDIPAAGGSFGIERLIEIIKERNMISSDTQTTILVTIFSSDLLELSFKTANSLRSQGINTLLYPDENAKLDKQLKYANKKQIPYVVIIGPEEKANNKVKLKNMKTGEQKEITVV